MNLEDRVRAASLRDGWQADRVSYRQPRIHQTLQVAEEGILLLLLVLSREVAAREEAARQPRRRARR